MDANQRRAAVAECLAKADQPVSATALARQFSVSRQIIVGDIALLRASGLEVLATPRGYVLPKTYQGMECRVACLHGEENLARELEIIVDNGCTVLDVVVEHPIYGHISGPLHLTSRYDVKQFVEKLAEQAARPLSLLTDGVHLHTIQCPDRNAYQRVMEQLEEAGILYQP